VRVLVVAALLSAGIARADTSTPTASAGWEHDCETQLRRAADEWDRGLDFASVDLFRRWDWNVGDDAIELRYRHSRTGEDYSIRISPGGRGRVVTVRSRGKTARREREAFLRVFRPALDACVEHRIAPGLTAP
jgi:hypothetical protein